MDDDAKNEITPPVPSFAEPDVLNDDTPVRIHAIVSAMLGLLKRITDAAAHEATTHKSVSGFYPITLLADAEGNVLCDQDAVPVVVRAPVDIMAIDTDNRAVVFAQPNQLVKRSEAAQIAGTSTSTLKRAEGNGELRAVKISARDTSYLMADLNGWMLRRVLGEPSDHPFRRVKKAKG
jgi:hypothetical protein